MYRNQFRIVLKNYFEIVEFMHFATVFGRSAIDQCNELFLLP